MTREEIDELASEVQCSTVLVEACHGFAVAERDGNLWPALLNEWVKVSGECGRKDCCFNKLGRDERSATAKEAVDKFAHNREVEEVRDHAEAWCDSVRT